MSGGISEEILKYQKVQKLWLTRTDIEGARVQALHELLFLRHRPPAKILDVGCRTGLYMQVMKKAHYEVEGIDVIEEYIKIGTSKGLKMIRGDASHLDEYYGPDTFDMLWMSHVWEHFDEPKLALENARKVIKTGGFCVLIFPKEKCRNGKHRCAFPDITTIRNNIPEGWKIAFGPTLAHKREWQMVLQAKEIKV
jgi:ubiquinone/menaquinone biosynthesis C-methylase UbiE